MFHITRLKTESSDLLNNFFFCNFLLVNVTVIVAKRHLWEWSGKTMRACLRNWKI